MFLKVIPRRKLRSVSAISISAPEASLTHLEKFLLMSFSSNTRVAVTRRAVITVAVVNPKMRPHLNEVLISLLKFLKDRSFLRKERASSMIFHGSLLYSLTKTLDLLDIFFQRSFRSLTNFLVFLIIFTA